MRKLKDILSPELIQLAEPYEDKAFQQEFICSLIRERASKYKFLDLSVIYEIGFAKSKLIEDFSIRELPGGRSRLGLLLGLIHDFYREYPTGPVLGDSEFPGLIQRKILEDGQEILIYEIKTYK